MWKLGYAMKAVGFGIAIYVCAGTLETRAADMAPYAGDPTPQTKVEFGTGWYIRGDAGWAFDKAPVVAPNLSAVASKQLNSVSVDLGGGYKFNNWIRGDMTLGLFGTQPVLVGGSPYSGVAYTTAELKKYLLLVNAYADLGTWYGVTPFVGVGAGGDLINGVSTLSTSSFVNATQKYNFAWALMAGVAYNFSENASVEVGYRYVNFGNFAGGNSLTGATFTHNLNSQEIRVGIRYLVD
jgi:opacity protein-like surface antigen